MKSELPSAHITDAEWESWMLDDPRNPMSKKVKDEKEAEKQRSKELKRIEKAKKKSEHASPVPFVIITSKEEEK